MEVLTQSNFNETVLNAEGLYVVGFFADWCGPCRMLKPVVQEISVDNVVSTVKFGAVNVDENRELVQQFNITGFPTLIFFKGGKEVNRFVGYSPKEKIQASIQDSL